MINLHASKHILYILPIGCITFDIYVKCNEFAYSLFSTVPENIIKLCS